MEGRGRSCLEEKQVPGQSHSLASCLPHPEGCWSPRQRENKAHEPVPGDIGLPSITAPQASCETRGTKSPKLLGSWVQHQSELAMETQPWGRWHRWNSRLAPAAKPFSVNGAHPAVCHCSGSAFPEPKCAGLSSNNSPTSRQHDVEAQGQAGLPTPLFLGSWRRQGREDEEGRGRARTFSVGFLWGMQHIRPSLGQQHSSMDAVHVAWSNQVGVADASASHPKFAHYPSTSLLLSRCPPALMP